ncbi:MAG: NAD(P)-binding domain-containing protein [Pseudomonadota bacterium]
MKLALNPGANGTVDVVIIGAGHAGLAMSYFLTREAIDHVILERGEVANSWRAERWDSLKLLTPNWQSRLPGYQYTGNDPDDYMSMVQVADFIAGYARQIAAPVHSQTEVTCVAEDDQGYRVETSRGSWHCKALVSASGACNCPAVPSISESLPTHIHQMTPMNYRNPGQLPKADVLVVGASASGLQLAAEIHQSGRPVTLAVGEHVRLPRRYRGRDIQWWLDTCGLLDEGLDDVDDVNRVRHLPSPQLVGSDDRHDLNLNLLSDIGVRLAGRLAAVRDDEILFSGSLRNVCALADLKMNRLLDHIDDWIESFGHCSESPCDARPENTRIDAKPCLGLNLKTENIQSVIWATGYRPDYSWLQLPVLDRKGCLRHEGGVVDSPGVYALGLPFLRRRKSTFIHGIEDDARELSAHCKSWLLSQAEKSPLKLAV